MELIDPHDCNSITFSQLCTCVLDHPELQECLEAWSISLSILNRHELNTINAINAVRSVVQSCYPLGLSVTRRCSIITKQLPEGDIHCPVEPAITILPLFAVKAWRFLDLQIDTFFVLSLVARFQYLCVLIKNLFTTFHTLFSHLIGP